ncbi:MAG: transposase [Variovorax sp.]|nr:transposase [Variovorax sp.]
MSERAVMVCNKEIMHTMTAEMEFVAATAVRPRRSNHSEELKRELVQRSLLPGASVLALAMEQGINANLLFAWRRAHLRQLHRRHPSSPNAPATLVPRCWPWKWCPRPSPARRQWPLHLRLAPTWRRAPRDRKGWCSRACARRGR